MLESSRVLGRFKLLHALAADVSPATLKSVADILVVEANVLTKGKERSLNIHNSLASHSHLARSPSLLKWPWIFASQLIYMYYNMYVLYYMYYSMECLQQNNLSCQCMSSVDVSES